MTTNEQAPISIAVVDDHHLFRSGLINLIHSFGPKFEITSESANGKEFISKLNDQKPDIVLMDLHMPVMDGFETSSYLKANFPEIKVLVLTMMEEESTMIKMLKLGIKGFLSKDVEPAELKNALETIASKGFYYTDYVTGKLLNAITDTHSNAAHEQLNEREKKFLELACSEYTYKEIADIMCLSIKTIDGYRNNLFEKLNAKSRVGLVLCAIKNKLVTLK